MSFLIKSLMSTWMFNLFRLYFVPQCMWKIITVAMGDKSSSNLQAYKGFGRYVDQILLRHDHEWVVLICAVEFVWFSSLQVGAKQIALNAALSACEKSLQWSLAMKIFSQLPECNLMAEKSRLTWISCHHKKSRGFRFFFSKWQSSEVCYQSLLHR